MPNEKILVVEDEESILELVTFNLEKENYTVRGVKTGEEALDAARTGSPSLVLLDLMLPGVDGLKVCKKLKNDSETRNIPIVMLTAKTEEADIVTGLEMGADDYITKPFSPRVLLARIKAVLRRQERSVPDEDSVIKVHDLTIHPGRHEVVVGDEPVDLTHTEFQLLHLLARRPGWVFTRNQIIDHVRGRDYPVTDRSVDVQVAGLRKKLGDGKEYIETVRGVGYRLKEER
ncbi:MAG: response regulator [Planctomycetota bacterium]